MNLVKLFEAQKVLRDRIAYNEPDRFNKLILALLVELGECANCWRGFKFWSKNQKPNYTLYDDDELATMEICGLKQEYPLLEEYVDGLHFVLELGIEHGFPERLSELQIEPLKCADNITAQFTILFQADWNIYKKGDDGYYQEGLELYLGLGEMLGFTWEQIERAYFDKNKVNHERQDNGY